MDIYFNEKRAVKIFCVLDESYRGNRGPFLPIIGDSILPPLAKSRKKIIDAAR